MIENHTGNSRCQKRIPEDIKFFDRKFRIKIVSIMDKLCVLKKTLTFPARLQIWSLLCSEIQRSMDFNAQPKFCHENCIPIDHVLIFFFLSTFTEPVANINSRSFSPYACSIRLKMVRTRTGRMAFYD